MQKPLAFRMRPTHIDEIVGQQHLVGKDKIIRRMVETKRLQSMILYGPPGSGKTSIASAIAGSTNYAFRSLNAAIDSKKDIDIVIEEAKMSGHIILLLDEIHRLNKVKQDLLLPHLENGRIILIGATTENPYFSINPALRSRLQIFELFSLTPENIEQAILRALDDTKNGFGTKQIDLAPNAFERLKTQTNGDVRSSLNALELAVLSTNENENNTIVITDEIMAECLQKKAFSHDKHGDSHYDVLSAFQKSIRGSDVNAALHYLARLILAEDLVSINRRLLVIAYEDIGFANPQAVERTYQAICSAERLGFPEARIPLSMAVIELALSPKSNSTVKAIDKALLDLKNGKGRKIPQHLQDAHYQGASQLQRGQGYMYPHDYPDHWVDQIYLPKDLQNASYYEPANTGKYEQALAQQLLKYQNKKG